MFVKKYLYLILCGVNLVVSVSLFGYLFYLEEYKEPLEETPEKIIVQEDTLINTVEDYINVEVKGAVKKPGVYQMNKSQIINDVINLAGGFKSDAYTKNINLSIHLKDEMLIYVYSKSEYEKLGLDKQDTLDKTIQKEIINTCLQEGESIIITGNDVTVVNKSDLININTASKEELITINGIGDAKANAIIEYRNTNGSFNSIEDILKVNGISQTLYDKIKAYITV